MIVVPMLPLVSGSPTIPFAQDWRLNITSAGVTGAASFCNLSNIEMRSSIGGPNVATGGTATASSTDGTSPAISAAFAGNTNSNWFSATLPVQIGYTFTGAVQIAEVAISFINTAHYTATAIDYNQPPLVFDLDYSTDGGSTWTTLWNFDMSASGWYPCANSQSRFAVFSNPVWYQFYITSPAGGPGGGYNLGAGELHVTHGGSNAVDGAFCSASSAGQAVVGAPNYPPEPFGLTDSPAWAVGMNGYGWITANNLSAPQWLSVGFYYPVSTMTEAQLTMYDNVIVGFVNNRWWTDFDIRSSTDFASFTTLYSATGITWSSLTPQTFNW